MHRTDVASRRFYRAFYRWSLLHDAACAANAGAGAGAGSCRHNLHTSVRSRKTLRSDEDSFIRYQGVAPFSRHDGPQNTPRSIDNAQSAKTTGEESAAVKNHRIYRERYGRNCPKDWIEGPIHSAIEVPFNTLKSGRAIVRYRSDFGVMVELAIRNDHLDRARRSNGAKLEKLSERHGARIEVQGLSAPVRPEDAGGLKGLRNFSVLMSGTFAEVSVAFDALRQFMTDKAPQTHDPQSHEEAQSTIKRPSQSLLPHEVCVRHKSSSNMILEISVPEVEFMRFVAKYHASGIAKEHNVLVDIGEPELRPTKTTSSEKQAARSFIISGFPSDVQKAENSIRNNLGRPHIPSGSSQVVHDTDVRQHRISLHGPQTAHVFKMLWGYLGGIRKKAGCDYIHYNMKEASASFMSTPEAATRLHELACGFVLQKCKTNYWEPHECQLLCQLPDGTYERATNTASNSSISVERQALSGGARTTGVSSTDNPSPSTRNSSDSKDVGFESDAPGMPSPTTFLAVRGPNRFEVITEFIGSGLKLERLKASLELQILRPQRVGEDIGLLASGSVVAIGALRQELRRFVKVTCKANGYDQHPITSTMSTNEVLRSGISELSEEQRSKLSDDVRLVSRALSHPVVLITAKDPLAEKDGYLGRSRGLTVSSFNTVTLSPEPIVSFNIKLPSRTWDAIYASERFRVTFLSATPRGAAIAHSFTRPYENPYEPFENLVAAKVTVYLKEKSKVRAPLIYDESGATMGSIQVQLLPDKCVEVGDHVIVVGKVYHFATDMSSAAGRFENDLALSYAAQAYQGADGPIEPSELTWPALATQNHGDSASGETFNVEADDEPDPLDLGDAVVEQGHSQEVSSQLPAHWIPAQSSDTAPTTSDDPLFDALRLTKISSESDRDIDIYQQFSEMVGPKDSEEDQPTQQPHPGRSRPAPRDDVPISPSSDVSGSSKRPYSTFARLPSFNTRRFYSSTATAQRDLSVLVNPSTAQTTISDYLCLPDDRRLYTPRVRSLVKRQSDALAARQRLTEESSTLDETEIAELQNLISTNENMIAKRLAWNAAADLRFMLDKGRYDEWFFDHVGWFESTIEKGQSVLLEEAKMVKKMWEEGRIGPEEGKFERVKNHLQDTFEVLSTETRRLARVMEEVGDDD